MEMTRLTMIARNIMFESPAIARSPITDNTHRTTRMTTNIFSNFGKNPIARSMTIKIRVSQRVTAWLKIVKRTKFGITTPGI